MKILVAHNGYRLRAGEDEVFAAECELLESGGHEVVRFERDNADAGALAAATSAVWAARSRRDIARVLAAERPDVAHFHNTFPLLSPSVYYACRKAGVPVVQTLHNYRLLCPSAVLYRDGHVCEDCLGRALPWPGVLHRCYRGSAAASATVASMLAVHRALDTWTRTVDAFVALSAFARDKFIAGGLPAERIVVKPNFLATLPPGRSGDGDYVLFAGRLTAEKGVSTLLDAWEGLDVPLVIAGTGPLEHEVARRVAAWNRDDVRFVGWRPRAEIFELLAGARAAVFPSRWYEGFGMSLLETFASGVPVVASRIGAVAEIVGDGENGVLFAAGDPTDLAAKVTALWNDPATARRLGATARREVEQRYGAERNLEQLTRIYASVLR